MGSNKPRKEGEGDLANPDRVQRDLDRYRDEMADDAPGSGTPKDIRKGIACPREPTRSTAPNGAKRSFFKLQSANR